MRLLLVLALVVGCADPYANQTAVIMTPQIVSARGTHSFAADRAKVYGATVGALKALGYDIAYTDEAAGVIKTAPRRVRAEAYSEGSTIGPRSSSSSVMVTYTRAYAIQLTDDHGQTRVEATPRLFQNGTDISERNVWDLNTPSGEYQLWYQLFREIGSNLGAAVPSPAETAQP